jgi:ribosomal protein L12E/L44/L45/RPP1/RPP2
MRKLLPAFAFSAFADRQMAAHLIVREEPDEEEEDEEEEHDEESDDDNSDGYSE